MTGPQSDADWRTALVESFADLFRPGSGGRQPSGWPTCGDGWRGIVERLCARIRGDLGPKDSVSIDRVREKLGVLRVDWHGEFAEPVRQAVMEAVNLASAASACTCEICGEEGGLRIHYGRLGTRCADHASGDPVHGRFGIVGVRAYRRRWGSNEIFWARYDRANDALVEVQPAKFGAEDQE